jgi:hypothetical protein
MSEQINPLHGSRDGESCPGCSHESHFEEKNMSEEKSEGIQETIKDKGSIGYTCMPGPKPAPHSMNGRFILEAYKEDRALKATVVNGFAMVQQKVTLKGLTVLADVYSTINGQPLARKGDKAYIREASLQSQPFAKATFTSDAIEGEFMIVDISHIEFVDHK